MPAACWCQPERIDELKAEHNFIVKPFNMSPKYWIGIDANTAPDDLLMNLTRNSYEIVKAKYKKKQVSSGENGLADAASVSPFSV